MNIDIIILLSWVLQQHDINWRDKKDPLVSSRNYDFYKKKFSFSSRIETRKLQMENWKLRTKNIIHHYIYQQSTGTENRGCCLALIFNHSIHCRLIIFYVVKLNFKAMTNHRFELLLSVQYIKYKKSSTKRKTYHPKIQCIPRIVRHLKGHN